MHPCPGPSWKDPFGSHWLGLWLADRADRKRGNRARIAARRGWLNPMGEQGKVVWILAGSSRESVHQAVELLRAIRARRLDLRLVLTFEEEYPDLLAPLDDCDKTGWGFAPADHPRSLRRVLQRLDPYGVLVVDACPRPHLRHWLDRQARVLTTRPHRANFAHQPVGNGADLLTLLVEAQVDPNFRSLANQGRERHLWWLHDADAAAATALAGRWLERHPEDIVFISGCAPQAGAQRISHWDRRPFADGSIVWIDEDKWLPAIAVSVTGAHFAQPSRKPLWQALAGGTAIHIDPAAEALPATLEDSAARGDLFTAWQNWRTQPITARVAGDSARRAFWQERRLAQADLQAWVERVFEW